MPVLVAHISDLHYNRADVTVADRLRQRLVQLRPNLLVVSGDLSDHPFKIPQSRLWVDELCNELGISTDKQLFTVPGNHDLRIWGNFGFKPVTQYWYRKHFGARYGVHYVPEHNLTIVCIDSNPIVRGFARGNVGRLQLASLQNQLDRSDRRTLIAASTKIAILHHHPFPVPFERSSADEFLVLENTHRLLQFLADNGIAFVLHGHNHMAPYSVLSLGTCSGIAKVVEVIGAGTAVAGGRDREPRGHNFNFITIEDGGLAYVRQFFALPGHAFEEVLPPEPRLYSLDSSFKTIVANEGYSYRGINWDASVDEEGDTFNEIQFNGLQCQSGKTLTRVDHPDYTADTGHLSGVWLNNARTSEGVTVENLDTEDPRKLTFRVHLPWSPTAVNPLNYSIVCYDLNAISLTRTEHRRKFPVRTTPRESLEMEMYAPTDEFFWSLKFPAGYKLPRKPKFEVVEADGVTVHEWLTQSLQRNFHYSDLGLCFVRIVRPPTKLRYKISWELPEETGLSATDNPGHRAIGERCARDLLQARRRVLAGEPDAKIGEITDVLRAFRELVARRIDEITATNGVLKRDDLEVSLMVYDDENTGVVPELRVVAATEGDIQRSLQFSLEIGDGNAGRAYKTNTVRSFDASNAEREPKHHTYVRRNKLGPTHRFLYSMPLRHPDSQHLIFGVLNVGSFTKDGGNFLRVLDNEDGYEWLLDVAQNYVLIRVLETLSIPGVEGGKWQ